MVTGSIGQLLRDSIKVKNLVGERVFPNRIPQWNEELRKKFGPENPAIRYAKVSAEHQHHMRAAGGLCQTRVQVDCYAARYQEASELAEAVRLTCDGIRGVKVGNYWLRSVRIENESDEYEDAADGSDAGVHRVILELVVWHSETVPTFIGS